jgi:hypothetical protein
LIQSYTQNRSDENEIEVLPLFIDGTGIYPVGKKSIIYRNKDYRV